MAVFEIQFSVPAFLKAQKAWFRAQPFCAPPPIPIPQLSIDVQIQRLEFDDNAMRRGPARTWEIWYRDRSRGDPPQYLIGTDNDADGFSTLLAQTVRIHTASFQAILDTPNGAAPPLAAPIEVVLVFEFDYFPAMDGGCWLQVSLDHVEWPTDPVFLGAPPAIVKSEIEKFLPGAFPARNVRFDDFWPTVPKEFPRVANAGISLSSDLSVLAFRVDPYGSISANSDFPWTNFFRGLFDSRLAGFDWALFTDSHSLCASIAMQVEEALEAHPIPDTTVDAVNAVLVLKGSVPVVVVHVGVYADVPIYGSTYFNFSLYCTISFDPSASALVFDIDLTDISRQSGSLLQRAYLMLAGLNFVFPGLVWALSMAFADDLSKLRNLTSSIDIEPDGFVCQKISDTHRLCTRPAQIPAVPGVTLSAQSVSGYVEGVAINGLIVGAPLPDGDLTLDPGAFSWSARSVSCGYPDQTIKEAQNHPEKFAYLYSESTLAVSGPTPTNPVFVCSLEVINDPQNLYPHGSPRISVDPGPLPIRLMVSFDAPSLLPTYPLDILVRTSSGIQLLRIPPPEAFDKDDAIVVGGAIKAQMLACPAVPLWWGSLKDGFDLAWIVNPLIDPDPRMIIAHQVDLRVISRGATAPLQTVTGSGLKLVRQATATVDGWSINTTVPAEGRLHLKTMADRKTQALDEAERRAEIDLTVTPIFHRARVAVNEAPRSLVVLEGDRALVVGMRSLTLLDLSLTQAPVVLQTRALPGVQGAIATRAGILTWTAREVRLLDHELHCSDRIPMRLTPLRDAVSVGSRIYLAMRRGVVILNAITCSRVGFVPMQGANCLLTAFGKLFVGGPFGVAMADLGATGLAFRRMTESFDVRSLHLVFGICDTILARNLEGGEIELALHSERLSVISRGQGQRLFNLWARLGQTVIYSPPDAEYVATATLGTPRAAVPLVSRQN